jgi:hypothetical protein
VNFLPQPLLRSFKKYLHFLKYKHKLPGELVDLCPIGIHANISSFYITYLMTGLMIFTGLLAVLKLIVHIEQLYCALRDIVSEEETNRKLESS